MWCNEIFCIDSWSWLILQTLCNVHHFNWMIPFICTLQHSSIKSTPTYSWNSFESSSSGSVNERLDVINENYHHYFTYIFMLMCTSGQAIYDVMSLEEHFIVILGIFLIYVGDFWNIFLSRWLDLKFRRVYNAA